MGGIPPLWRDVLYCHEQRPIHMMIGGGDQLYCDDVWNLPALAQWLQLTELAQRLAHPFTQDMADQVEWFYFTNYVKHWSQAKFSDALGSIPQVNRWGRWERWVGLLRSLKSSALNVHRLWDAVVIDERFFTVTVLMTRLFCLCLSRP